MMNNCVVEMGFHKSNVGRVTYNPFQIVGKYKSKLIITCQEERDLKGFKCMTVSLDGFKKFISNWNQFFMNRLH